MFSRLHVAESRNRSSRGSRGLETRGNDYAMIYVVGYSRDERRRPDALSEGGGISVRQRTSVSSLDFSRSCISNALSALYRSGADSRARSQTCFCIRNLIRVTFSDPVHRLLPLPIVSFTRYSRIRTSDRVGAREKKTAFGNHHRSPCGRGFTGPRVSSRSQGVFNIRARYISLRGVLN